MISSTPKWIGDLLEGFSTPVKVVEAGYITPNIKKIRFQGNISRMNFHVGYANVIRISGTEYRNYTVAYYNKERGIMDIIFHLHGNGAGSRYIGSLETGNELRITIPRGQKQYEPEIKRQIIFGDETSLGLACSFLPYLKTNNHQFRFYFELDEDNKNAPAFLGLENCILFPKDGSFRSEEWVSTLPVFDTPEWLSGNFILTGNVRSVQTFRKVLKDRKIPGRVIAKGYWLEGKTGL